MAKKATKKEEVKSEKTEKADKKAAKLEAAAPVETTDETAALEDADELEEQEEVAAAGGDGNAAALAAASSPSEMSASFKNFRHHPDMENFYRFIFENDLRHEALAILDGLAAEKLKRKAAPGKVGKEKH